jgi:hypothetical protein
MRKLVLAVAAIVVVAVAAVLLVVNVGGDEVERATTPASVVSAPSPVPEDVPEDAVSVYPAPGVVSASRETQLSFRNVARDAIGDVEVKGERSGRHTGKLLAHSDGEGASFVPDTRFRAGETVSVKTDLKIAGAQDGDYEITIARPAKERKIRAQEPPSKGKGAVVEVRSRPDLIPPAVTIDRSDPDHQDGLIFLGPKGGRGQDGVMIVDDDGELVYFKPMPKDRIATDFRVQTYEGKPALTWWQGGLITGDGRGYGVVYDEHYKKLATVHMGNGYAMDLHEFTITPRGTALAMAYDRVKQDLSELGGPKDAVVIGAVVQEIDVKTGLVLFEWHSVGSIGLDEGKAPLPEHAGGEYDYMHLNSIDLDPDGNFIVSARNTWGVYKIDRRTAQVVWRLGGTKPTFKMGEGTTTAWQHHARLLKNGDLMLYDNGASPRVHEASRAIVVRVDERAKSAKLVSEDVHPDKVLSATQGSAEPLANGDVFVGYGSQRYFGEFDKRGKFVFGGQLARGNDSYRAFRLDWTGRPAEKPRAVATRAGGRVRASVSWNGATEVARWQLLAGEDRDDLERAGAPRRATGFETTVRASTGARYVALRALDADGKTLGTSAPVEPQAG